MKLKLLFVLLAKVIIAIIFAGIFYFGWMVVAILTFRSGQPVVKALCWLFAPIVTAAGFIAGILIFELFSGGRKSRIRNIILWPLIGCTIGAAVVFPFGPMLIVFGMFILGAISVLVKEIANIKRMEK